MLAIRSSASIYVYPMTVLDVVEGAYDLIIRNAPLVDSSLIVRKLASDRRVFLWPLPAYLKQHGVLLQSPEELVDHQCVSPCRSD